MFIMASGAIAVEGEEPVMMTSSTAENNERKWKGINARLGIYVKSKE